MSETAIITDVVNANTRILCKNCMDMLHKHYPGHPWIVGVDDVGGIVNITHPRLSGLHGFTLHISKIDNDFKSVIRGAGELLERFRVKRGKIVEDDMAILDRTFTGDAVHDE